MYIVYQPPYNRHVINEEDRINLLKSKSQHRRPNLLKSFYRHYNK